MTFYKWGLTSCSSEESIYLCKLQITFRSMSNCKHHPDIWDKHLKGSKRSWLRHLAIANTRGDRSHASQNPPYKLQPNRLQIEEIIILSLWPQSLNPLPIWAFTRMESYHTHVHPNSALISFGELDRSNKNAFAVEMWEISTLPWQILRQHLAQCQKLKRPYQSSLEG